MIKKSYANEGGENVMDKTSGKSVEDFLDNGSTTDNPGNTSDKPKDSSGSESPKYKIGDRELTPDELFAEYQSAEKLITRTTTELQELKARGDKQSQDDTKLSPDDQAVLATLKAKFGVMTRDEMDAEFAKRRPDIVKESVAQSTSQVDLKSKFDKIEQTWNGEEGRPKVERAKVLKWLEDRQYPNIPLDDVVDLVYKDDFRKYEIAKAGGEASPSVPTTERNGAGTYTTPPPKAKYNFDDGSAERAVAEMLKSSTR